MATDELSEEELAELDDESQIELLVQTDQGLSDDDQIPQPPQDKWFRANQEGSQSA
jgi:hypothetical protein